MKMKWKGSQLKGFSEKFLVLCNIVYRAPYQHAFLSTDHNTYLHFVN
jgi:hypothetical protein